MKKHKLGRYRPAMVRIRAGERRTVGAVWEVLRMRANWHAGAACALVEADPDQSGRHDAISDELRDLAAEIHRNTGNHPDHTWEQKRWTQAQCRAFSAEMRVHPQYPQYGGRDDLSWQIGRPLKSTTLHTPR